jgi:phosphoribosylaminoimidazole-succinocarboxamide synthase
MRGFLVERNLLTLAPPILQTTIAGRAPDRQGKVRDIFEFGDRLLIVATDRISAFDYVLGSGIPDKGKVLSQISTFWFNRTRSLVPNHVISTEPSAYPPAAAAEAGWLSGRSMLVTRTEPLPIECVARGYLSGSGWKDYQATGTVCGIRLGSGLRESDRLPQPIFTPATKAQSGHDINISEVDAAKLVSQPVLDRVRELTLRLYAEGAAHAESCGIIVADTKFEFGLLPADGAYAGRTPEERVLLIDEMLTPDSSRFWPRTDYAPGGPQPSFDKQFVRDYLEQIRWNKQPPVPSLPDEVILKTRDKYVEAFRRLTGRELDSPELLRGAGPPSNGSGAGAQAGDKS